MKALSLTQPWATLVALGVKRLETRSWSTRHRGPLAIHAARALPGFARDTWHVNGYLRAALLEAGFASVEELPRGVVVATGMLAGVDPVERVRGNLSELERALGDYSWGRYAWRLSGMRPLPEPEPARGALGLWEWEPARSTTSDLATGELTHVWRWRSRLPERHGERCRVTARGSLNSVRIEFADGFWVVTSRWAVRRVR